MDAVSIATVPIDTNPYDYCEKKTLNSRPEWTKSRIETRTETNKHAVRQTDSKVKQAYNMNRYTD